ncbi:expressed unknown protein [Seminavis robusta]|uniref:Uncharacterized protein n=1 Tax=Seminavis robusta TaxID=568900 RepID=A0A9N8ERL3_9STRA|nr:expressed unknown protein [Seminavis robusta]|eukprot:Sro1461_g274790.1 n/a (466) ;mRNA; r:21217-22614
MAESKMTNLKSTGEDDSVNEEKAPAKESKYHRGKWTNEECEYMLALMEAFKAGQLPLREGTTLRSFLSSMMKCKPKRISKKFEGISYNGRMVYQRSKDPFTLQQAMLLRARLSELERRYLSAAAEQREGGESIDALLSQEKLSGLPSEGSFSAFATPAAGLFSAVPRSSFTRDSDLRTTARLPQGLGLLGGSGGLGSEAHKSDDVARLLGAQTSLRQLNVPGGLRNLDATNNANPTSLISAGLAAGNDALRNIQALRQPQQQADFPALSSSHSILGDFHAQLREMDQQQQLASSLSNANAASTLAAMQFRERALSAQLSQATSTNLGGVQMGTQGLGADVLPSLGLNASHQLPRLSSAGGQTANSNEASSLNHPSVQQHNLDVNLNRFVLQAPQDDATYFRQRLLPGVSALTNSLSSVSQSGGLTSQDLLQLRASANAGGLSELMKRKLQENELQDSARAFKRQR